MTTAAGDDDNKYLLEIQRAFIDNCSDHLEEVEKLLDRLYKAAEKPGTAYPVDDLKAIRRIAHNLKGSGHVSGFPGISILSHRLEDYLAGAIRLDTAQLEDVRIFVDGIEELLDKVRGSEEIGEETISRLVRQLPVKKTAAPFEVSTNTAVRARQIVQKETPDELEALLVMSSKLQQRLIEQELLSCGFRVTNITSALSAIDMALHIKPDLILSSQVIDGLIGGVELAKIFSVLKTTQKVPFILLTSDNNESSIKNLPDNVRVARKNENFIEDFAERLLELDFFSAARKTTKRRK